MRDTAEILMFLCPVLPFGSVGFLLRDVLFGGLQYCNPSENGDWFSSILIRSDWLPVISISPWLLADEAKSRAENAVRHLEQEPPDFADWTKSEPSRHQNKVKQDSLHSSTPSKKEMSNWTLETWKDFHAFVLYSLFPLFSPTAGHCSAGFIF